MKQYTVRDNMSAAAAGSNELVRRRQSVFTVQDGMSADAIAVLEFGLTQLDSAKADANMELDRQEDKHKYKLAAMKAQSTQKLADSNNSLEMLKRELEISNEKIVGLEKSNLDRETQLQDARDCLKSAHEKRKNSNCCCWVWFMIAVVVLLFVVFMVSVTCYTDHHNSQFVANAGEWRNLTEEMLKHLPKASETEFKHKIKNLPIDEGFTTVCPQPVMSMFGQLKQSWDEFEI